MSSCTSAKTCFCDFTSGIPASVYSGLRRTTFEPAFLNSGEIIFFASPTVIAKETGVPRNVVDHFLRQEFLEIPKLAPERLSCQQCGAPIRTGYLCDKCKSPRQGIVDKSMRGRWYTGKSL